MEQGKFKLWWLLLIKGLAASILGVYIMMRPEDSLQSLVMAIGVFLLIMGGTLITAAIFSPPGNPNFGPWLGGFQPAGSVEPGGGWEWLNNEGGFGVEDMGAYTNWHPPNSNGAVGEPNNGYNFTANPETAVEFQLRAFT